VRDGSMHPRPGVSDLVRNCLVGLLEAHGRQEILHPERVVRIVFEEQPDLAQVVLGAVRGAGAGHPRVEEPFGVLCGERIHGARV
jgi:hypothetical protein